MNDKVKQNSEIKKTNQFVDFLKRLSHNRAALLGICIVLILVVLAILAPYICPYAYDAIDPANRLQGPSAEHWFGTDQLGRDILSRVLYGGRYSLSIGVLAVLFALVISLVLGTVTGYFGGICDTLIMRFLDIIQAVPTLLLAIILSAVLGSGFIQTVIALSVPSISVFTRVLRAQVMQESQNEYVEAVTSLSISKPSIMFKHILPNSWSPLIVSATMGIANSILNASSLSFIGLGIQSPTPEWGAMLSNARDYMRDYPYMIIFPGIFIVITVLGLNVFGDAIRDILDPKLKD